jgi:hypothetical protein
MTGSDELNDDEQAPRFPKGLSGSFDDLLSDLEDEPLTAASLLDDVRQKLEDLQTDVAWFRKLELKLALGGTLTGDESCYLDLFGIRS